MMKKMVWLIFLCAFFSCPICLGNDAIISEIYENHRSNVQVSGKGVVAKILPDDNEGSRHQKFILRLNNGITLLIAHNIDIAPRLESLKESSLVEFYGEYEWNDKGGVVRWTHRDPNNNHVNGWLIFQGKKYE